MKKYYDDAKYNAAFDRCVDVMSRLIEKYGPQILDRPEKDSPEVKEYSEDDMQTEPLCTEAA